jgi:hypothetical protein
MVAARRIFDYVVLKKMANEEGDAVKYRGSKRESIITDKMAAYHMGKERKGSKAAATTRHDWGGKEVGGSDTEGDVAKELVSRNKDNGGEEEEHQGDYDDEISATSSPGTNIHEGQLLPHPYNFYVRQLVNVIAGKASHQASIVTIENEKATVRWMTWKGVVDVQVNQLCPIWDGLKRKRKQIDLF